MDRNGLHADTFQLDAAHRLGPTEALLRVENFQAGETEKVRDREGAIASMRDARATQSGS